MHFSVSLVPPSAAFGGDAPGAVAKAESVARDLGCAAVRINARRAVLFVRADDGTIEAHGCPADLRLLGVGVFTGGGS